MKEKDSAVLEERRKVHFAEDGGKKQVMMGADLATQFIKKVVSGERVDNRKYTYNIDFILELSRRVLNMPHLVHQERDQFLRSLLRQRDGEGIGYMEIAHAYDLPPRIHLYSEWYQRAMATLAENPEDITMALELSAAAHYGFVNPKLHPLVNGNGRVSRALMNAMLMSQSYELTAYRWAIPPIPIVRDERTSTKYIAALDSINHTGQLNLLMSFIACRWRESTQERLGRIYDKVGVATVEGDKKLIDKLENRVVLLNDFVALGVHEESTTSSGRIVVGDFRSFRVPDFFVPQNNYVKFTTADTKTV